MLIKCPECGKEISDKAQSCPNCGCPAETSANRKIRYIDDEIPKCPMCHSYNIRKISGASKVASGLAFGVFAGKKIMSQYKCDACGHLF